jgi:S-(hydroxymethyl)glutathione dehydrogenase/alcohol dehydrogenase
VPRSTADEVGLHVTLGLRALAERWWCRTPPRSSCHPELPLEEAALFGCAVLTGVGAVVNTARVRAGSSVAVIGLGGVGLSSLLGAVAAGAGAVVAIDLADDKLAFARELGATDYLVSDDRLNAGIQAHRPPGHRPRLQVRRPGAAIRAAWRATRREAGHRRRHGCQDDLLSLSALDIFHSARGPLLGVRFVRPGQDVPNWPGPSRRHTRPTPPDQRVGSLDKHPATSGCQGEAPAGWSSRH